MYRLLILSTVLALSLTFSGSTRADSPDSIDHLLQQLQKIRGLQDTDPTGKMSSEEMKKFYWQHLPRENGRKSPRPGEAERARCRRSSAR